MVKGPHQAKGGAIKGDARHRQDISDKAWGILAPMLPGQPGQWGGIAQDNRRFINGVFSVRQLIKAGVPALGGTDAGTPFNPHGELARQLDMLCKHGLTVTQALRASTSLAARALKKEKELGRLAAGLAGDILAVDGHLESDLYALRNIRRVWRDGLLLVSRDN